MPPELTPMRFQPGRRGLPFGLPLGGMPGSPVPRAHVSGRLASAGQPPLPPRGGEETERIPPPRPGPPLSPVPPSRDGGQRGDTLPSSGGLVKNRNDPARHGWSPYSPLGFRRCPST